MTPGIELHGISKRFPGGITAVEPLDLTIPDGEFFAIVGPSGSGKSTLLRMIAGLETPTTGTIWIGGRDVTKSAPRNRDVAMVFQHAALYPHLSVFENLAFSARAQGSSASDLIAMVQSVAGPLDLLGVLKRKPQTLSGGQKQRVALGRAILRHPAVFLLDEPMSSLDAPLRATIRVDLICLQRSLKKTMILVTHDQREALALGHRVGVMERGRIVQVGTPEEIYERPASPFVARFVGDPPMSLLRCEVQEPDHDGVSRVKLVGFDDGLIVLDADVVARSPLLRGVGSVEMGIRPEHVQMAEPGASRNIGYVWTSFPSDVVGVEFLGHERIVTISLGPNLLKTRVGTDGHPRIGDRVVVGLDLRRASWFHVR